MSLFVEGRSAEAAYQEARSVFDEISRQRASARRATRYEGAPRDIAVEEAYGVARHRMMVALHDLESEDENASVRKQGYMAIARLPPRFTLGDVLYYTERGEVHLFYGGRLSHIGFGDAPDGLGHGHVILSQDGQGGYEVVYHRRPR